MEFKDLVIQIKGEIISSNFNEFKVELLKKIKAADRKLVTDQDFIDAKGLVKQFGVAEKTLVTVKADVLEKAKDIQELFEAIDEVSEQARSTRLSLARQIKTKEAEIKQKLIDSAKQDVLDCFNDTSNDYRKVERFENVCHASRLQAAIKGKQTIRTMQKAIDEVTKEILFELAAGELAVNENRKSLDGIDAQYKSLFQDEASLLVMTPEVLDATISKRIAVEREYVAQLKVEAERIAREKAELEAREKKLETLDKITDTLGRSDGQTSDEIRQDLEEDGVDVDASVERLKDNREKIQKTASDIQNYCLIIHIKTNKNNVIRLAKSISENLQDVPEIINIRLTNESN